MSNLYIKAVIVTLIWVLLSGCAVYVRDDYHHHHRRGYHHWRGSSLDSPDQAVTQLVLNHEVHDLGGATTPSR